MSGIKNHFIEYHIFYEKSIPNKKIYKKIYIYKKYLFFLSKYGIINAVCDNLGYLTEINIKLCLEGSKKWQKRKLGSN